MSAKGQLFKTTCFLSSSKQGQPVPPDATVTAADLDPAADVQWLVSCGALVPLVASVQLFTDTPTVPALVEEIGRLQAVCESQADVIDRQAAELASVRAELAAATAAKPLDPSKASFAPTAQPVASVGTPKASMNPTGGRVPAYPPPVGSAVMVNAAGHVVANPDRPNAPKKTQRFGDAQPAILPVPGQSLDPVTAAVNASLGVAPPPAAPAYPNPLPTTPNQFDPVADRVAELEDRDRAARTLLARQAAELDALRAKLAATQPGLDGQPTFANPTALA